MKFALFFGNRGFFPESLVASARAEMCEAVTKAGHEYICLDSNATKFGAISTGEDGIVYAKWLKEHIDEVDGAFEIWVENEFFDNGPYAFYFFPYDTGVEITPEDKILILQTCSYKEEYSQYNKRYLLIVSRKVEKE